MTQNCSVISLNRFRNVRLQPLQPKKLSTGSGSATLVSYTIRKDKKNQLNIGFLVKLIKTE